MTKKIKIFKDNADPYKITGQIRKLGLAVVKGSMVT